MNDRQFRAADAAIDRTVAGFVHGIDELLIFYREGPVAPSYIVEGVLLKLCDELTKLVDKEKFAETLGPATMKLSNALADYRDSQWHERE